MLDIFIILGIFLALFFLIVGKKMFSGWAYLISAILFLVIGMGLFVSGYQTADNAPININADATRITFEVLTTNPVLDGTPNEQMVFAFAIFFISLTLILIFLAIEQSMANKAAKDVDE